MFGKTGVEVTILNAGTLQSGWVHGPAAPHGLQPRASGSSTPPRCMAPSRGSRNGSRKCPRCASKSSWPPRNRSGRSATSLKNIDQRLAALGTDYIDLLYYHGLGRGQIDWVKSREMKEEIEAIKKTGKVRFVGFTTHDGSSADQLQAAAEGGFVDAIMLSYAPWLAKDSALEQGHGRLL